MFTRQQAVYFVVHESIDGNHRPSQGPRHVDDYSYN